MDFKLKHKDFKLLRNECKKKGRLFEDRDFPATNSSLYFSKQPPFHVEWKRPMVRPSRQLHV